jgi:hypothetical protein
MRHDGDPQSQLLQKVVPVLRLCNGAVMPALGFGLSGGGHSGSGRSTRIGSSNHRRCGAITRAKLIEASIGIILSTHAAGDDACTGVAKDRCECSTA